MESAEHIENQALKQQLANLLQEARVNEEKMRRFDLLERKMISAHALPEIIDLLLHDYRAAFEIEFLSLLLVDPNNEIRNLLDPENQANFATEHLYIVQEPESLKAVFNHSRLAPKLCAYDKKHHQTLFKLSTQTTPSSLALIPLQRQGQLMGGFFLGSSKSDRYQAGSGTDFLERLSYIISICIENVLAQERLKQIGLTDGLTGVQNRRYFEHRYKIEIAQSKRHHHPLACMLLDIDRFKKINDTYGHPTGDEVLKNVAQCIQGQLRAGDTIARYGGEEFVVLLPHTAVHHAQDIAERIRQKIAHTRISHGQEGKLIPVTISIGLAVLPPHLKLETLEQMGNTLLASADSALYEAKRNGRNRVVTAITPLNNLHTSPNTHKMSKHWTNRLKIGNHIKAITTFLKK